MRAIAPPLQSLFSSTLIGRLLRAPLAAATAEAVNRSRAAAGGKGVARAAADSGRDVVEGHATAILFTLSPASDADVRRISERLS